MLYIYKINQNPIPSPFIARCLTDGQKMHQYLCGLIHTDRTSANLLFRLDIEHMYLFVQSDICPDDSPYLTLVYSLDIDSILKRKNNHDEIHFQLTTDTRKKKTVNGITKKAYVAYDEIFQWLTNKLQRNGLSVIAIRKIEKRHTSFVHQNKRGGYANITMYDFDIRGRITDIEKFRNAWHNGMGEHKAYGNGLFLLCK